MFGATVADKCTSRFNKSTENQTHMYTDECGQQGQWILSMPACWLVVLSYSLQEVIIGRNQVKDTRSLFIISQVHVDLPFFQNKL